MPPVSFKIKAKTNNQIDELSILFEAELMLREHHKTAQMIEEYMQTNKPINYDQQE